VSARHADAQGIGQPFRAGRVLDDAFHPVGEPISEAVAQSGEARDFIVGFFGHEGAGRTQTGHFEDVLGSGSQPAFVARTADEGFDLDTSPQVKGADAFGCVEFVARDRQQIDA